MSKQTMLVNAASYHECRIAVVEDSKLEELYVERASTQSHVGNIYLGKVTNVEAAIQAAFIDFSTGRNGFLHISDLHPRYFPGEDENTAERVGKKTPRRDRPPIQQALHKGQEIMVQVLKDGIGTKGPTLTSYISIPGRYLVMMPNMQNMGVSRRVEDEEKRREMRQVLDSLDTPEGFGFILRTAGLGRSKTELKRDLAYLMRLWKDMQARRKKSGNKPMELYAESDLLTRTIRDVLNKDITRIIVDDISALKRISRFLRVIAPRSGPELVYYDHATPIFHAFGIESQIAAIRSPRVPLPSGGGLVIEQTEALVAIDVNSGKSRASLDAESTAYNTNMEAVREIARQVRLRDLGGLIVNDLIDMVSRRHQAEVENAFREHLKKDRARTKILRISQFGIVEMTRQRMRSGIERSQHTPCPHCEGSGIIKRPETVALDAMRSITSLLEYEKVARVEIVVAARVASELLSNQRIQLCLLEQRTGKKIDVRISEDLTADRADYYAYDQNGSDINLDHLPKPRPPRDLRILQRGEIEKLTEPDPETITDEAELKKQQAIALFEEAASDTTGSAKKKRRRSKRKKPHRNNQGENTEIPAETAESGTESAANASEPKQAAAEDGVNINNKDQQQEHKSSSTKRRRRRGRRSRDNTDSDGETGIAENESAETVVVTEKKKESPEKNAEKSGPDVIESPAETETATGETGENKNKKRGRSRRNRNKPKNAAAHDNKQDDSGELAASSEKGKTDTSDAAAEGDKPAAGKTRRKKISDSTAVTKKKTTKKKTTRKKSTQKKVQQSNGDTGPVAAQSGNGKAGKTDADTASAAPAGETAAGEKSKPKRRSIRATTRRLDRSRLIEL